ncbi:stanniocalcin-like [Ciona intestinalis]
MYATRHCTVSRSMLLPVVLSILLIHLEITHAVAPKLTKRQSAGIVRCVKASNVLGCGTFECLKRTDRCKLGGLALLCSKFQRKTSNFNQLGRTFTKQSLRCMATQIKSDFQRAGRQCSQIENFVSRVQADCYRSNNVCRAAMSNYRHFKQILLPKDILTSRSFLQMFQSILSCGEAVTLKFRDTVTSALGQSFLSMLNYLQKGATSPLIEILGQEWVGSAQFRAIENEVPGSSPRQS